MEKPNWKFYLGYVAGVVISEIFLIRYLKYGVSPIDIAQAMLRLLR